MTRGLVVPMAVIDGALAAAAGLESAPVLVWSDGGWRLQRGGDSLHGCYILPIDHGQRLAIERPARWRQRLKAWRRGWSHEALPC